MASALLSRFRLVRQEYVLMGGLCFGYLGGRKDGFNFGLKSGLQKGYNSGMEVGTQSLQNPLIKEYTLNYNRIPYMI